MGETVIDLMILIASAGTLTIGFLVADAFINPPE